MRTTTINCDRCGREARNDADLHGLDLWPKWISCPTSSWEPGGQISIEICYSCTEAVKTFLRQSVAPRREK